MNGIRNSLTTRKFLSMLVGGSIGSLVASLITMSDSIVAGLFLGKEAVAAVSLVVPAYSLSWFFTLMVTYGASIIYSREIGSFNKKRADEIFGNGVVSSITVGVILFILFNILGTKYLIIYGAQGSILLMAERYIFWMGCVMLISPISYFLNEMIYADGDETIHTLSNLVSAAVNLGTSVVLCRLTGIIGIGIGSLVGTLSGLVITCIHFIKKTNALKFRFYFSPKLSISAARYSLVDGGLYLFYAFYLAVINRFIIRYFGEEYLILASVILMIAELELVFDGIGEAMNPVIGVYLTEESFAGIRKILSIAAVTAVIEGVLTTSAVCLLSGVLPGVFGIESGELKSLAQAGIIIMSLGFVFSSLNFLMSSYYLIIDRVILGFAVTMLRAMVVPLASGLLLGRIFGIYGLFAGIAVAAPLTLVISQLMVRVRVGKENYPFLIHDREMGKKSYLFELEVEPKDIIATSERVEEILLKEGIDKNSALRVMRACEEIFMLVYDKNPGEKVLGECSVILDGKTLKFITRCNGRILDMTDTDMKVDSFRGYSLSQLISTRGFEEKGLAAMSFNRNMLKIDL
jgi:Na+-driven multidrug efflux pump